LGGIAFGRDLAPYVSGGVTGVLGPADEWVDELECEELIEGAFRTSVVLVAPPNTGRVASDEAELLFDDGERSGVVHLRSKKIGDTVTSD